MQTRRGPVGLFHTSLADVGGRYTFRFRLGTDFFRHKGFIYDGMAGPDQHSRIQGGVNLGFTPLDWGEVFLSINSSANRNQRGQIGREDPETMFALGDIDFGVKAAHRFVRGGAVGLGGQLGLGLLSGTGRLLTQTVNFWFDVVATVDLRYLTNKHVPVRFSTNIGWMLDNSLKLLDFDKTTDTTSREVTRFSLGMNHSRVRMRYALDFPIRLGKQRQFGLDPLIEWSWDVSTQERKQFAPAGVQSRSLARSSQWLTIGLRANVVSGLFLDAGIDIGLLSPGFEFGPAVPPWQMLLGFGWSFDPTPVVKEVPTASEPIGAPGVLDGRVVGTVVDEKGAPLANARVTFPGLASNAVITDETGRFVSYRFPAGSVAIRVEAEGRSPQDATAEVSAGQDTELTITVSSGGPTPATGVMEGRFTDDTDKPIKVTLRVSGMGVDEPFQSDETGSIAVMLPVGDYNAVASAPGFQDKPITFKIESQDKRTTIQEKLSKEGSAAASTPNIKGGTARIALKKKLQFTDSAINEKSHEILDELATFLNAHPEYKKIEIGVHTDDRGNPGKRSQERADAVRTYLLGKGVTPDRVVAKGYGDRVPVAVNMTSAGRAQNNRVEIKVLGAK